MSYWFYYPIREFVHLNFRTYNLKSELMLNGNVEHIKREDKNLKRNFFLVIWNCILFLYINIRSFQIYVFRLRKKFASLL